jgi:hypothetical protein
MKDEDFEMKLKAMGESLNPPDPTSAWRTEIISRAMSQAESAKTARKSLPPRWLMASWGFAWAAVLVLNLSAPTPWMPSESPRVAAPSSATGEPPAQTLFAYNRLLSLNIDLP